MSQLTAEPDLGDTATGELTQAWSKLLAIYRRQLRDVYHRRASQAGLPFAKAHVAWQCGVLQLGGDGDDDRRG